MHFHLPFIMIMFTIIFFYSDTSKYTIPRARQTKYTVVGKDTGCPLIDEDRKLTLLEMSRRTALT